MKRSREEFKEEVLKLIASSRMEPDLKESCEQRGLTWEGARQMVLERSWFNRSWPRWLGSVVANCPHKDVNKYLITNMYEEGVTDRRVGTDHNELLLRMGEALGLTRDQINDHQASPVTVAATSYWANTARTRPWLEGFAALVCLEISASRRAMGPHYREKPVKSSEALAKLGLSAKAIEGSTNHDAAEEDHGTEALVVLLKHSDTEESQESVLKAIRESLTVIRMFNDNIGRMMMNVGEREQAAP
jgi:pyrroloquinoline-quinone synthase